MLSHSINDYKGCHQSVDLLRAKGDIRTRYGDDNDDAGDGEDDDDHNNKNDGNRKTHENMIRRISLNEEKTKQIQNVSHKSITY
jgi:hypothetical protein